MLQIVKMITVKQIMYQKQDIMQKKIFMIWEEIMLNGQQKLVQTQAIAVYKDGGAYVSDSIDRPAGNRNANRFGNTGSSISMRATFYL